MLFAVQNSDIYKIMNVEKHLKKLKYILNNSNKKTHDT